jgi:hypothetical protein
MAVSDVFPDGWAESFIVREMGDELLVYNLRNQRVTSLNAFAAGVWRASNGTADIAATAAVLGAQGVHADNQAIESAFWMLIEAGLIEGKVAPPTRGASRRDFLGRMFKGSAVASAMAVATPAVVTILAPTPAHAASCSCPPETPYCLPGTNECVECLINEECIPFGGEFCGNNECFGGGA